MKDHLIGENRACRDKIYEGMLHVKVWPWGWGCKENRKGRASFGRIVMKGKRISRKSQDNSRQKIFKKKSKGTQPVSHFFTPP